MVAVWRSRTSEGRNSTIYTLANILIRIVLYSYNNINIHFRLKLLYQRVLNYNYGLWDDEIDAGWFGYRAILDIRLVLEGRCHGEWCCFSRYPHTDEILIKLFDRIIVICVFHTILETIFQFHLSDGPFEPECNCGSSGTTQSDLRDRMSYSFFDWLLSIRFFVFPGRVEPSIGKSI